MQPSKPKPPPSRSSKKQQLQRLLAEQERERRSPSLLPRRLEEVNYKRLG